MLCWMIPPFLFVQGYSITYDHLRFTLVMTLRASLIFQDNVSCIAYSIAHRALGHISLPRRQKILFCWVRMTKTQTRQWFPVVWSEHLLFTHWKGSYLESLWAKFRNFNFLTSPCSWAGWFKPHLIGNPEDRFSRIEAAPGFLASRPRRPIWQQPSKQVLY